MRIYLCSIIPETGDANFSWDGFMAVHLEFGNKIGNFIHRCLTFQEKHWPEGLSASAFTDFASDPQLEVMRKHQQLIVEHLDNYEFIKAKDKLFALSQTANEYFHINQPWMIIKNDRARAERSVGWRLFM
jgi:methionyl-tRNA synthetase